MPKWCQRGAEDAALTLVSSSPHPADRATGPLSRKSRLVFPLIALLLADENSGFDGKDPDPHNDSGALLVDDSDVHVLAVSRGSIDDPAARRSVGEDSIT